MSDIEPILDGDLNPIDPFRYCVHCGVDCYHPWAENGSHDYDPDVEHKPNCPTVTGLYPVTMETLGMRGPDDPYAFGARCMDCGVEFKLGDTYALRRISEDGFEVVCVGCRVLNPEAVDAD